MELEQELLQEPLELVKEQLLERHQEHLGHMLWSTQRRSYLQQHRIRRASEPVWPDEQLACGNRQERVSEQPQLLVSSSHACEPGRRFHQQPSHGLARRYRSERR